MQARFGYIKVAEALRGTLFTLWLKIPSSWQPALVRVERKANGMPLGSKDGLDGRFSEVQNRAKYASRFSGRKRKNGRFAPIIRIQQQCRRLMPPWYATCRRPEPRPNQELDHSRKTRLISGKFRSRRCSRLNRSAGRAVHKAGKISGTPLGWQIGTAYRPSVELGASHTR